MDASPLTDRPAFCHYCTLLFIGAFLLNNGTPAFADVHHCGFYLLCAIGISQFWLLFIFGSFLAIDNTRSQRVSTLKEFVSKRRRAGFAPSKNFCLNRRASRGIFSRFCISHGRSSFACNNYLETLSCTFQLPVILTLSVGVGTIMPHIQGTFDEALSDADNVKSSDALYGYPHGSTSREGIPTVVVPAKKRKRTEDNTDWGNEEILKDQSKEDADIENTTWPPKKRKQCSGVRLPSLVFPKSQYHDWQAPLPISQERDVLTEFMVEHY